MNNAIMHGKIADYKNEYSLQSPNMDFESSKEDCLSEISARELSTIKKLQISDFCTHKLFLQQIYGLKKMIPKQIMTLEEKYLRHCLELIHTSAMTANSWPISSSKVNRLSDKVSSRVVNGYENSLFLYTSGDENLVINSSVDDPIVGSITGSTTMINLLNSHLLRQLGTSDDNININYGNPNAIDLTKVPEDQTFECESVHKRLGSFSSTNSTFSDPSSSSSSSGSYCQGMLHCSWNNGFPRYVFSVEDHNEVYTTNLTKIGSEYVYTFYSRGGKKEYEIHEQDSDIVGKMRVSNFSTLCPPGTEIMETQFILYGMNHSNEGGMDTSNQTIKKSKTLLKNVSNIFRGNRSTNRHRTWSKFDGSVSIQDESLGLIEEGNLLPESGFSSNLELVAIVVKDYIPYHEKTVEVGGWGLKFLNEKNASSVTQCRQSRRMDVVVPAGFHGGPVTKNGGPSGLVERWRNGGSCDCGGWDIGCPINVLNAGPNNKHVLYQTGVFGNSNSFELYTQGSKQSVAVIEVRNVHDGLYYIHYQSGLSALQSLSIAVGIIHSHSPTLKPKVLYRN